MAASPPPGDDDPGGSADPFGFAAFGLPGFSPADLGIDLARLGQILHSPGPVNWELARQVAAFVATDGADAPSVERSAIAELEDLARAAQTHVVAATALTGIFRAPVRVVNARAWADLHLDALKPVLEALAQRLSASMRSELAD